MPPFRPELPIVRQRLLDPLDSTAPAVAVVGSRGAGVSTLLQQWSAHRTHVRHIDAARPEALTQELDGASVFVIDDADRLDADAWRQIAELMRQRPGLRVRLGLASARSIPAEWDVDLVRDLAFSSDELLDYLAATRARVDPGAIFLATGGHVRSVRILAASGITRPERFRAVLGPAGGRPLAPGERSLAVPKTLTPALVADLGGAPDVLERAERDGLGSWVSGDSQPVFQLSPLTRAATAARHPLAPADERAIRVRAAALLFEEQSWFHALMEAAALGDLRLVDAALKRGGMPLLADRGRELLWVLRTIPAVSLRRWPVIAMAQALILNARRQHSVRAAELMGVALLGIQASPKGSPDRALLRTIESVARRLTGVGDGGAKAARTATRMLDELPDAELAGLSGLHGDIRVHSGISLLYAGELDEAREQFERAGAGRHRVPIELMAIGGAAMIHALQGDIQAARAWVDQTAGRSWPPELLDEYPGSMLRIAHALIALESGALDDADAQLAAIWPIIDTIEHWPVLGYVRALIDVRSDAAEDGAERLRLLRERRGARLNAGAPTARMLDLAASTLALGRGDVAAARRLEPRASDRPWVWLGAARVAVFEGDDEAGMRLLAGADATTPGDRLTRLTLEGVLLNRLGRRDEAAGVARRAAALARAAGMWTPFALLPADDREVFEAEAPEAPAGLRPAVVTPRLTERESVILRELFRTSRVDEIAARLHVSTNTVKSQRRSLYRKLGVSSRQDALARAMADGLTDAPGQHTRAPDDHQDPSSDRNRGG